MAQKYTAKWNPMGKVTTTNFVMYAVQFAALIVLSWAGTVSSVIVGPGIGLYWPYPFYILFVLWFGAWGIFGVYFGSVIGGGLLTGASLLQALTVNLSNLIPVLLIFLLYRIYMTRIGRDPFGKDILNNKLAAFWFVIWVMIITNVIGGLIGVWGLIQFGALPSSAFNLALITWVAGDIIVLIAFPFLSKYLTPIAERYGLLTHGWIT